MNEETRQSESNWKKRGGITAGCALAYLLIAPAIHCGHVDFGDILIMAVPVGWGILALFSYRDRKEQIVGWIAFLLGMLAVWVTFE